MKKIMFNDRYGLTQSVLEGRKTMTRRIIPLCENDLNFLKITERGEWLFSSRTCLDGAYPAYCVGEEVAVAQKYKNCWDIYQRRWEAKKDPSDWHTPDAILGDEVDTTKGWKNKMFVKAEYMPHRIRITINKAERLQNISEEDAMREGIRQSVIEYGDKKIVQWTYFGEKITTWFDSPREAFAALIDRISGRGTWNRNPWVFAYEFELLR